MSRVRLNFIGRGERFGVACAPGAQRGTATGQRSGSAVDAVPCSAGLSRSAGRFSVVVASCNDSAAVVLCCVVSRGKYLHTDGEVPTDASTVSTDPSF